MGLCSLGGFLKTTGANVGLEKLNRGAFRLACGPKTLLPGIAVGLHGYNFSGGCIPFECRMTKTSSFVLSTTGFFSFLPRNIIVSGTTGAVTVIPAGLGLLDSFNKQYCFGCFGVRFSSLRVKLCVMWIRMCFYLGSEFGPVHASVRRGRL